MFLKRVKYDILNMQHQSHLGTNCFSRVSLNGHHKQIVIVTGGKTYRQGVSK